MKLMSISTSQKSEIVKQFEEYLEKFKTNTGKLSFTTTLDKVLEKNINKPTVFFKKEALEKMEYLVNNHAKEVAWHGVVSIEEGVYVINDILVYPQTVTAATVETDDKEYATWMNAIDNDTFNKIRFQGHSHVNMATKPSSTDTTYYEKLLNNLQKGDFYIFFILNKRNDYWINIYDYTQNVIFEKDDITIVMDTIDDPLKEWFEEASKLVKERAHIHVAKGSSIQTFSNMEDYYASLNERFGGYRGY